MKDRIRNIEEHIKNLQDELNKLKEESKMSEGYFTPNIEVNNKEYYPLLNVTINDDGRDYDIIILNPHLKNIATIPDKFMDTVTTLYFDNKDIEAETILDKVGYNPSINLQHEGEIPYIRFEYVNSLFSLIRIHDYKTDQLLMTVILDGQSFEPMRVIHYALINNTYKYRNILSEEGVTEIGKAIKKGLRFTSEPTIQVRNYSQYPDSQDLSWAYTTYEVKYQVTSPSGSMMSLIVYWEPGSDKVVMKDIQYRNNDIYLAFIHSELFKKRLYDEVFKKVNNK